MSVRDLQRSGSVAISRHDDAAANVDHAPHRYAGLAIHPLLAAIFPILSLYSNNIDETPLRVIWRPLGISLLGTLIVWALVSIPFRQVRKSAIITTFVSLIFFSYGHIVNQVPWDNRPLIAPICFLSLLILIAVLLKVKASYLQATRVLNLAALALVLPSLFVIGARSYEKWSNRDRPALRTEDLISTGHVEVPHVQRTRPRQISAQVAEALPDIYYIILDAYGRADSLKHFYNYDNTPFISELEKRGFYVAKQSHANYPRTAYCLPTSLNMNYLDALTPVGKSARYDSERLRRLIDENAVANYLRGKGYHYLYLWTGEEATRVDTADLELDNYKVTPPSSFEGELFELTALDGQQAAPILSKGIAASYDSPRAEILTAFHNLEYVPRLDYPKFVFAHILSPHPPFIFDEDGKAVNPKFPYDDSDGAPLFRVRHLTKQDYQHGYIGQLQYMNRRTLEAIDAIKRQSKRPPIIIVQGDHGSRMNVDWDSQERTDLREPFSPLNAYLVPDAVRSHLYPTITPVNSFRVLLNQQFGEKYPLLPDRSYFSTSDHPLLFTDVTNDIRSFDAETDTLQQKGAKQAH